jgi:uncharacterized protein HemY
MKIDSRARHITRKEAKANRLLEKLREVHGAAGRPDIASEITVARRVMARRVEAAAELVPAG